MESQLQKDKAGSSYWDNAWAAENLPMPFDPNDNSLDNTFYRNVHIHLSQIIEKIKPLKVLEIGCAQSVWARYFKDYYDINLDGLDYSEIGCKSTQIMWDRDGLKGKIYCADMFLPPQEILGTYDLVISFGVIEHFEDTAGCIHACSNFLRPDGYIFTMIPNMSGLNGLLQKIVDPQIYSIHMPLNARQLGAAHRDAGLEVLECRNFMSFHLGVVNSGRFSGSYIDRFLRRALSIPTKLIWLIERMGVSLAANNITSPYILVLAKKIR